MSDTLFRDLSEHNAYGVSDVLSKTNQRVVLFRSNDGTYRDQKFAANLAAAKAAADSGRLDAFGVYFVFEDNWQTTFEVFKQMVGKPHPKMFVVIDLESWGGKIRGDHSAVISQLRSLVITWLRSYRGRLDRIFDRVAHRQVKRVLVYGNVGDLTSLFPKRPAGLKYIVAAYGSNPAFDGKLAHQFADDYTADGLPAGDINSADGLNSLQFAAAVGCHALTPVERAGLLKVLAQKRLQARRLAKCKKWGCCK